MKKKLSNVTLIAVSGNKYGETLNAIYKTLRQIEPARTVYVTDTDLVADGIEFIKVPPIKSWEEYNRVIMRELYKYFDTEYCLLIQHDGYVLNGDCWDDEFLNYDYIGARWLYTDGKAVGNGGFSLRSHRLQEIVANDPVIEITAPEDEAIARLYRTHLETVHGIKFGTNKIADKFSFELHEPVARTFGFHGYHFPEFLEHIVLKRGYALGDVLMLEPLIEYYSKKNYQVVLDTNLEYMGMFMQYPYRIKHIKELNPAVTPIKFIDFDMSYERKPKQLVLKSYYEAAGITDGVIRNSRLKFNINESNKLFKKYVVLHIDETGVPHRNIRGMDWKPVVTYLEARGYSVFQVGNAKHEEVGIFINAASKEMLSFVLAGADLFIGIDSGVSHIAVALGIKSVIFFGSVNPKYRYAEFENIRVVQNKCMKQNCYHEAVSEVGIDCAYDKSEPPCTFVAPKQFIDKINELIW